MSSPGIHDELKDLRESRELEPFIRHIRFPKFRNLQEMLQIEFTHPISAIVGPNGTNKTSILRALQGCPDFHNIGTYWFSTALDPINDGHRFVHGYLSKGYNQVVEVIKMRITAKGAKSAGEKVNIDYFEPSRPIGSAGMEIKMPTEDEYPSTSPDRSQTRWRAINKKVLYLDFRTEVSAFDKYYYHGPLENDASMQQRKDRIRLWSRRLALTFENSVSSDKYFGKERIDDQPKDATLEELNSISTILGRTYSRITFVRHNYFHPPGLNSPGWTIRMTTGGLQYSEAFAGSGEFAVAMIVHRIIAADPCTLVILDEPEVSLHPGAQEKLVEFLCAQIKKKHHQIVFATHSPDMIRNLPPDAIKVLDLDPHTNNVYLTSNATDAQDAFLRLGSPKSNRLTIYVEDNLAKIIIERALRPLAEETKQQIAIEPLGGASKILQHFIPAMAKTNQKKVLIYLDGDQNRREVSDPSSIPPSEYEDALKQICNGKPGIFVDGGNDPQHQSKLEAARRNLLLWMHDHLDYFPGTECPEVLLSCITQSKIPDLPDDPGLRAKHAKEYWRTRTCEAHDLGPSSSPSGDEILFHQKQCLAKIDTDNEILTAIRSTVQKHLRDTI